MLNESLYVYGIVKFGFDLDWKEQGIEKNDVYTISEGKFSALVHNCEQKPYISQDLENIKELIISHNMILDKAMKDFDGVIPLHFNTIIKSDKNTAHFNLKRWLKDDLGRLEKIWQKIKGKKEYGLRIYYEKDKLIEEISGAKEVKKLEKEQLGKSQGLSYLLQTKVKSKINDILQERIIQLKQGFSKEIKKIVDEVKTNVSQISVNEKKDLLVNLSILVSEKQIMEIRKYLKEKERQGFCFQLAGPFAPYSFTENGKQ